jgi:hypothetical protein
MRSAMIIAAEIYGPLLWLLAHMLLYPLIVLGELALRLDQAVERWAQRFL